MSSEVQGDKVVAVALGVFTQYVDGVTAIEAATTGTPLGYCAAVSQFQKHLSAAGYPRTGNSCWRYRRHRQWCADQSEGVSRRQAIGS